VTGYLGSQETILAMERGEAPWPLHLQLFRAQDRQAQLAARQEDQRAGTDRARPEPRAPRRADGRRACHQAEDRGLLELMAGPTAMARPFAAPPGLPASKTALLRRAFDATMADGEFRAEAAKMQADLAPRPARTCKSCRAHLRNTPRPVIERLKKILAPS